MTAPYDPYWNQVKALWNFNRGNIDLSKLGHSGTLGGGAVISNGQLTTPAGGGFMFTNNKGQNEYALGNGFTWDCVFSAPQQNTFTIGTVGGNSDQGFHFDVLGPVGPANGTASVEIRDNLGIVFNTNGINLAIPWGGINHITVFSDIKNHNAYIGCNGAVAQLNQAAARSLLNTDLGDLFVIGDLTGSGAQDIKNGAIYAWRFTQAERYLSGGFNPTYGYFPVGGPPPTGTRIPNLVNHRWKY